MIFKSKPSALVAVALGLLFVGTAAAQDAQGPRWAALAGCWSPVFVEGTSTTAELPRLCVIPGAGESAEVATIADGKVERSRVTADGVRRDVAEQGCNGWESAHWSADGRRLYLRSEQTCAAGVARSSSGIFSLTSEGDWLSVSGVTAGSGGGTRAVRYSASSTLAGIPVEIVTALGDRAMARATARMAATASLSLDDVVEASRAVDSAVVATWLGERGQPFAVDARALRALKSADVAPSIIDVVVAVSHPKHFVLAAGGAPAVAVSSPAARGSAEESLLARQRLLEMSAGCDGYLFDPYGYNYSRGCDPLMQYGMYRRGGYSRYNPYYNRYDPYGYGYGGYGMGGYYGNPVTIIVRGTADDPATHGVVDRNRGYRQGSSAASSGSSPAPRATSSGDTGGSSAGSTSSGSAGSGSTGSTSGTAKPRPPGGQ